MNDTLFLVPKAGLQVRDPDTTVPLPAEGAEKPRNQYWLRRLQDGDVSLGRAPAEVPPRAASLKTKPQAKE